MNIEGYLPGNGQGKSVVLGVYCKEISENMTLY